MLDFNFDIKSIVKKMKPVSFERDSRFWVPQVTKGERYEAVIRFLPDKKKNLFEKYYEHVFMISRRVFSCVCPTTFNEYCPLCEHVSKLYELGRTEEKFLTKARERKRFLRFVTNIYVVSDTTNPQNNGKVFLFRYGKKINQMLLDMVENYEKVLEEGGDDFSEVCMPWHPGKEGAFFKLVVDTTTSFYDYSPSRFVKIGTPLFDDEEKILEVINQTYDLDEIYEEFREQSRRIEQKMKEFNLLKVDLELDEKESEIEVKPKEEEERENIKKVDVSDIDLDDLDEFDELEDIEDI